VKKKQYRLHVPSPDFHDAAPPMVWHNLTKTAQTARTLEAEMWQVCGEVCVRGQRKMSQLLGAFGLLDFTMLRPVLAWRAF